MTGARYAVGHDTRYVYTAKVSTSQHVAHLAPRTLPRQVVETHTLEVDPAPAHLSEREDYFGNRVHGFTILTPHESMRAASRSVVTVSPRDTPLALEDSPAWDEVASAIVYRKGAALTSQAEFSYGSPYAVVGPELAAFARASFLPGLPLLDAAGDLMHRIHDEFTFDPSATTITTPVTRVLADRHGVCQDFAHLMISSARSLGLAARYVSGYLLTDPPPGQPRLTGADASHAWVSVHCPRHGWVDFDPTNACLPDIRHITIGWGRDYGDVSPLRGLILGGAQHALEVGVSVTPA
jgi:transglutaminase-like putative cysteine protease